MDDPDPSLTLLDPAATQAVPVRWGTEYRLAHDAAFDVLRSDLSGALGGLGAPLHGRALFVLDQLDRMRSLYRVHLDAAQDGHVPSDAKDWTLDDELKILRHLAVVIHDHRLAATVLGDEYLLRKFWEYGYLRSVENMCHDARQDLAAARSGDLKNFVENWAPRQASVAADLTSRQPVPVRRARWRAPIEPTRAAVRRSRAAAKRAQAKPQGR
jgi:hypothetical protein